MRWGAHDGRMGNGGQGFDIGIGEPAGNGAALRVDWPDRAREAAFEQVAEHGGADAPRALRGADYRQRLRPEQELQIAKLMRVSQYSLPPGISEISPASGSVLQDTTRHLNEPRARSRLEAPGAGGLQAGWSRSYETRAPHALRRRAGRAGAHPLQALGARGAGGGARLAPGRPERKSPGHAASGRRLVGAGRARARVHALPLPGRWRAARCPIRPRASIRTTCTGRARSWIREPSSGKTAAGAAARGRKRRSTSCTSARSRPKARSPASRRGSTTCRSWGSPPSS